MKRVLLDEESPSAGDDARRPLNNSSSLNEWINDESISTEKRAHSKVPTSEEDIGGPEIDTYEFTIAKYIRDKSFYYILGIFQE